MKKIFLIIMVSIIIATVGFSVLTLIHNYYILQYLDGELTYEQAIARKVVLDGLSYLPFIMMIIPFCYSGITYLKKRFL